MHPSMTTAEPGTKRHEELVKAIMRIEEVVLEALPDHGPEDVLLHVNAMVIVAGVMVGKLKAVELIDSAEEVVDALRPNFLEGVDIGEKAGRRTILDHFGEISRE